MNRIKCSGSAHPNAGQKAVEDCSAELSTAEPLAPGALYLCRACSPQDSKNNRLGFQTVQFDKDLRRSSKASGTNHISRQGNQTNEFAKEQEMQLRSKGLI